MKKLLLIDASSIIYRCFHALPPMNSRSGSATNALYGVSSVLLRLWREDRPDFAAALFDRPEPTFRKEAYAEYKAQRAAAPDELISQVRAARELFRVFGIKPFEAAGWEADDLIATLARQFGPSPDLQVVILTGDLDTLQLVQEDKIVVRTFRKGISDTFTYDESAVRERYGLAPAQLVDYKALVGDSSDNIKGVSGIGPKTACAILTEFGDLDTALSGEGKLADKLRPHREAALRNRDLVSLRTYPDPLVNELSELAVHWEIEEARMYFLSYGFETLVRRLDSSESPSGTKPSPARDSNQGTFF